MKNKTRNLLIAFLFILVFFSICHWRYQPIKPIPFISNSALPSFQASHGWETFQNEYHLANETTKIENIELIVDQQKQIHSIKFNLIDFSTEKNTYTTYHYQQCITCEDDENKAIMSQTTSKKVAQYEHLIEANFFFSTLDTILKKQHIVNEKSNYTLLFSTGNNEGIAYDTSFSLLKENQLKSLTKPNEHQYYQGFNLQVLKGNTPFSFGEETIDQNVSQVIFIEDVQRKKLN